MPSPVADVPARILAFASFHRVRTSEVWRDQVTSDDACPWPCENRASVSSSTCMPCPMGLEGRGGSGFGSPSLGGGRCQGNVQ